MNIQYKLHVNMHPIFITYAVKVYVAIVITCHF